MNRTNAWLPISCLHKGTQRAYALSAGAEPSEQGYIDIGPKNMQYRIFLEKTLFFLVLGYEVKARSYLQEMR